MFIYNQAMLFSENTTDVDLAYKIVESHYDHLDTNRIKLFNDGYDHAVLVVDGTQAFRFPKNADYLEKLRVTTAFLQRFAPSSPVVVPNPELKEENNLVYETYTFIEGAPLTEEIAAAWSEEKLVALGDHLGSFFSALHRFPVEEAETIGVSRHDPLEKWQKRHESIQRLVIPAVGSITAEKINQLFEGFSTSLRAHPPILAVIHADTKPAHIIVHPEHQELTGIIDFGDMEIGDPAEDFTFFQKYRPDITPFILASYRAQQDNAFLERLAFYQKMLPIMELDHAFEVGMKEKAEIYLQNLSIEWQ